MRKKIFLIILFLSTSSFSQDLETLKKADTIYLLFEKKNNQHLFESYQEKLNINLITFHFFTHPPYGYTFLFLKKKMKSELNYLVENIKN